MALAMQSSGGDITMLYFQSVFVAVDTSDELSHEITFVHRTAAASLI